MKLSNDQAEAVITFLMFLQDDSLDEIVLEGHSGTGKTFMTSHLVEQLDVANKMYKAISGKKLKDYAIVYTASTNKAAAVLAKRTGEEVNTIHSILGLRVVNDFSTGKTLLKKSGKTQTISNTLLVIDEASMIDKELLNIIRELTSDCKILFIGDPYQLAPVFESDCPVFTEIPIKMKLTTIQRQAKGNPIIELGEVLRKAVIGDEFPKIHNAGVNIEVVTGAAFKQQITDAFTSNPKENQYKILAWTNNKVHAYNDFVRGLISPSAEFYRGEYLVTNKPLMTPKKTYASTDETVIVRNVYKGNEKGIDGLWVDLGFESDFFVANVRADVDARIKQLAKAAKLSGKWAEYFAFSEFFADLRPTFASTVHKSQGSTYDTVFVDLADIGTCTKWNEVARMLYVATTRASNKLVIFGSLPERFYNAKF